ncbi:hypothetical protein BFL38_14255 [Brachyspira hampsonii]|uniref:Uncharacterized protein n=1 Tax=Brachyspira hampsonii TaxID=1287055 RepID=A0A1E5NH93_9SPIR|nr:hypothetical protein [Brachyspira hampsonii]OEJ15447.1 hypothetical protein BFL38_14255 [Brachyspira hampsonii]
MDKTVCNFCDREVSSEEIITLKGFKEDSFLGVKGDVQIWYSTICTDCYLNMRERIAKKEMNLKNDSFLLHRIVP